MKNKKIPSSKVMFNLILIIIFYIYIVTFKSNPLESFTTKHKYSPWLQRKRVFKKLNTSNDDEHKNYLYERKAIDVAYKNKFLELQELQQKSLKNATNFNKQDVLKRIHEREKTFLNTKRETLLLKLEKKYY
jgi:hypothetical protein